ncbi:MAG TPA: DUF4159 domain-containing protein [Gammaproteobacteria bacterium]|jgi:hypothetical protein
MHSFKTLVPTLAIVFLGAWAATEAQETGWKSKQPTSEFHFVRLLYNGTFDCYSGGGWGRGSACVDWPDAEYHFMQGINRLTRVDGAVVSRYNGDGAPEISLADDAIFDYPWLYAVEVGDWYLDDHEAARLREYLLRGGFLMVDDFHGNLGWQRFYESIVRVFPDRPIIDIPDDDEVLHVLYDLDQRIQIPGRRALFSGRTWEGGPDGKPPHWRGIYDDESRLVVAINHNMDLGDAWEHADTPGYPQPMTALAYRFAVNYVIYAITH